MPWTLSAYFWRSVPNGNVSAGFLRMLAVAAILHIAMVAAHNDQRLRQIPSSQLINLTHSRAWAGDPNRYLESAYTYDAYSNSLCAL